MNSDVVCFIAASITFMLSVVIIVLCILLMQVCRSQRRFDEQMKSVVAESSMYQAQIELLMNQNASIREKVCN